MHRRAVFFILILVFVSPLSLEAQDSVSFSEPTNLISFWDSSVNDIAVHNRAAYVALDSDLRVIGLSDARHPSETAILFENSYKVRKAVAFEDYLYVLWFSDENTGRMTVLDISSPRSRDIVAEFEVPGTTTSLCIQDSILFIGGHASLKALSLADPLHPEILSETYIAGGLDELCIQDTLLYAFCFQYLNVIDISDLENIQNVCYGPLGFYASDGIVYNDYLYISWAYPVEPTDQCGTVFSLENPANPIPLGTFDLDINHPMGCYGLCQVGDNLLLFGQERMALCQPGESAQQFAVIDQYINAHRDFMIATLEDSVFYTLVQEEGALGLQRLYLEDDEITPMELTYWRCGNYLQHVQKDNFIFAFVSPFELLCFDISNPDSPARVAGNYYGEDIAPYDIRSYLSDDMLYTIDNTGEFQARDISHPRNIQTIWTTTCEQIDTSLYDLDGYDNLLVLNQGNNSLEGWSIENRIEPVQVWTLDVEAQEFTLDDAYLYVFTPDEFSIFELSDSDAPELLYNAPVPVECLEPPALYANYLYVPSSYGIVKINVSNPRNPRTESLLSSGDYDSRGIQIQFPYVYNLFQDGIQVFDIWNPLQPFLAGTGYIDQNILFFTKFADMVAIGTSHSLQLRTVNIPNIVENNGTKLWPSEHSLVSFYPNPFNGVVRFSFTLQERNEVQLDIVNIEGKVITTIVNSSFDKGTYQAVWSPENCASGVYFASFRTYDATSVYKLIYTK